MSLAAATVTQIEKIILRLADEFNIRISWDLDTVVWTTAFTAIGTAIGGYSGGKVGAAIGAGVGGATGLAVSTMVSLRQVWESVKKNLKELLFVIYNFLRRLDPDHLNTAIEMLMMCTKSRKELVVQMVEFLVVKLGREVVSSITAA